MKHKYSDFRQIARQLISYFKTQEEPASISERDDLWQRIEENMQPKGLAFLNRNSIFRIFISISVAAAFVGLVWLSSQKLFTDEIDISTVAQEMLQTTTNNSNQISLLVSGREVIAVKKGSTISYSSNGTVRVNNQKIADVNKEEQAQYNQIIVPKGKFTRLILSDGSNMYINAGTRVVYPRCFQKNKREIFVDGEIYIDVKRNEHCPFFVKTANFDVEVLGTAFNINAYSDEQLSEVALVRGLIKVTNKLNKETQLLPNQLVSLSRGEMKKRAVVASEYALWTQGLLSCENESLGFLFRKLERYYGINIQYESSVEPLLMNGNLDLNCSLEEVLRRISITAPITYYKSEAGYIIRKFKDK